MAVSLTKLDRRDDAIRHFQQAPERGVGPVPVLAGCTPSAPGLGPPCWGHQVQGHWAGWEVGAQHRGSFA